MGSAEARTGTLEEGQVRAMFDRIARVYDRMNSVMTAGLHHRWRERAAELAQVGPGDRALDVATGTGDLAIALARRVAPGGEVVGSDFSEGMLALARRKDPDLRWEWGNALELPYADGEFDAATVGFGARNFSDLDRGLAEMARVVRPGGRVVVLEITTPAAAAAVDVLLALVRPRRPGARPADRRLRTPTSTCRARSSASRARRRSPARLAAAGLVDVRWILTAGGIIALHAGTVRVSTAEQVLALVEAGGSHVPEQMERLEARLAELATSHGALLAEHAGATISAGGKRLRPLLVFLAAGPEAAGRPGRAARGGRGRADPLGDARARRRARRRGAAPRAPDRGGHRRPRDRDGDRRPAVLARVRRAGAQRAAGRDPRAVGRVVGAGRGGVAAARGRVGARRVARALPAPLRSQDRAALPGRVRARGARGRRRRGRRSATSGAASGSPSSCSTTCSTSRARAERTGKHRGTDLLDGTVTLPLILARERDPALARARPARRAHAGAGGGGVRRDRGHGRARAGARGRARTGRGAKADLPPLPEAQRAALELVADSVVDRYAAGLEVHRPDGVGLERRRSARSPPPCWPGSGA